MIYQTLSIFSQLATVNTNIWTCDETDIDECDEDLYMNAQTSGCDYSFALMYVYMLLCVNQESNSK